MNTCLSCGRVFPETVEGEIAVGGYMLCKSCGHVMVWSPSLTLREMTPKEQTEAGSHMALMRARSKIIPRSKNDIQYRGSWVMSCLFVLIIGMVIAERTHLIGPIHKSSSPVWGRNVGAPPLAWPRR